MAYGREDTRSGPLAQMLQYPVVKDEEFDRLRHQWKQGLTERTRQRARDRIIYGNVRLVLKEAYVAMRRGMPISFPDAVQEGLRAVMNALERFDPARGCKFSTYAVRAIKRRLQRAQENCDETVPMRIPVYRWIQIGYLRRVFRVFLTLENRWPTDEEALEAIHHMDANAARDMRLTDIAECRRLMQRHRSLQEYLEGEDGDDERTLESVTADPSVDIETTITARRLLDEHKDAVGTVLASLHPRDAKIITMRFGLGPDNVALTLAAVGDVLEITRERVRQLEDKALDRLAMKFGVDRESLMQILRLAGELAIIAHSE